MRVKKKLPNKEITILKKDDNFSENKVLDNNKTCSKCLYSEFRFTCFYDLKKRCNCKILKGKFNLIKENNCHHYKYNSKWKTRIHFAEVAGEDISFL